MSSVLKAADLLEDYLTPEQLAGELNRSPRTIARWASLGIGPPVTVIGRQPHYRHGAVREWLLKQERGQVRAS
jgi:hypothetical protein